MQSLYLYKQFAKKENSTKVPPSGTLTLALQGILKEPCSIMTPVIKIERLPADAIPGDYTYARWVQADRYYFIEDWVWANGLWEVHMKEDVLATFKTDIGNSTEYVLRTDSTSNFNGEIIDTTYPATTDIVTNTYSLPNIFTTDITVGCYIVGIISGGQSNAVGAITYFAMTSAEFGALKNKLFSNDNLEIMGIIDSGGQTIITDLSQEVLKTLYNPYQYIVSCIWFPFGKSAITNKTSVTAIKIGWWEYPLTGDRLYAQTIELGNEQLAITAHPQASRGSYLNYSPYTKRTIIGRFGTVAVDMACFKVGEKISISYRIDLITGQCYTKISVRNESSSTPSEKLIAERNFLLGVPIQIAQVGTDYLGSVVSAINTVPNMVGGALSGFAYGSVTGAVVGAIAGGASGIYNTIETAMPQVETSGQNGSFLAPVNNTHVVEQFYKIVDEDIAHRGRPLCELRQLNTLSGFILCAEGEIDISCYDNERKEIVRYLTTGFFWE
ncbi:MAG: hypothetical protein J6Q34_02635 [Bacteroidales bacterium]|nr:hypothetical protein [Bacteroidales bacterium]